MLSGYISESFSLSDAKAQQNSDKHQSTRDGDSRVVSDTIFPMSGSCDSELFFLYECQRSDEEELIHSWMLEEQD